MGGGGRQAPTVAVDVAVFTVIARALHLLLVQVQHGAFRGRWALPGGRVGVDESLDQAARREFTAQTGLSDVYLEQLYTFGSPQRDPHGRVVSVAYVALIAHSGRFQHTCGGPKPGEALPSPARGPGVSEERRPRSGRAPHGPPDANIYA